MTFSDDPVATTLRDLPFTYPERGWTAWSQPPAGYHGLQRSVILGTGADLFQRAGAALLGWQVHRRAGVRLVATDPTAVVGARVRQRIGLGPLAVTAPCQVVWTVRDEHRLGFAYGTLTGHPLRGEESFVVARDGDDQVSFTIRSFSRPATALARLGGPFTPLAQSLGVGRYLAALVKLVETVELSRPHAR